MYVAFVFHVTTVGAKAIAETYSYIAEAFLMIVEIGVWPVFDIVIEAKKRRWM